MISVEDRERIRRAYFVDKKSIRQIARELHCGRRTVGKAITTAEPLRYRLTVPRPAPILGPYKAQIDALLAEREQQPRKQRYTGHKIYQLVCQAGYAGSESTVRSYIGQQRRSQRRPPVYLPLEFDPGQDAQVDWGEAQAIIAGESVTVQLFVMRLCYSRRLFLMVFPAERQEAFFAGHVAAFHHFQGVPRRIAYDNLTAAVRRVLTGHSRQEQQAFVVFRSHYLFASHFCTPGQGHEKGGVEHGVGFGRRNFLVPVPEAASYVELNGLLLAECQADDTRQVDGQPLTIGEAWAQEKSALLPLPVGDFPCCLTRPVHLTPYSQVQFETNRYSVPVDKAQRHLVLKAYPFQVEILYLDEVLARHPRCYGREQDIFDPLHYLPLLEQRPGAFEHAKPLRRWRETWPPVHERLLARLRTQENEGQGVREFVRILRLHQRYPAQVVAQAIECALTCGCLHADGVELCLHQLQQPTLALRPLDLGSYPHPAQVVAGTHRPSLQCYGQLLKGR